jgi:hypothetical protein
MLIVGLFVPQKIQILANIVTSKVSEIQKLQLVGCVSLFKFQFWGTAFESEDGATFLFKKRNSNERLYEGPFDIR